MSKRRGLFRRLWDNLVARTLGYYVVLLTGVWLLWVFVPGGARILLSPAGEMTGLVKPSKSAALEAISETAQSAPMSQMISAVTAMTVAALVALPVAWLYFVTQLDDEILKALSAEQLEVVAEKAMKRRKQAAPDKEPNFDVLLRVRTRNPDEARRAAEPLLQDRLKKWRFSGVAAEGDGVHV